MNFYLMSISLNLAVDEKHDKCCFLYVYYQYFHQIVNPMVEKILKLKLILKIPNVEIDGIYF